MAHHNYVQQYAPQNCGNKQHWYYYCNHSGNYESKISVKRQLKTQLGERCIAHIKDSRMNKQARYMEVQYCSTHYNHEISLGHKQMHMKLA